MKKFTVLLVLIGLLLAAGCATQVKQTVRLTEDEIVYERESNFRPDSVDQARIDRLIDALLERYKAETALLKQAEQAGLQRGIIVNASGERVVVRYRGSRIALGPREQRELFAPEGENVFIIDHYSPHRKMWTEKFPLRIDVDKNDQIVSGKKYDWYLLIK